jgi:hypothetical protein
LHKPRIRRERNITVQALPLRLCHAAKTWSNDESPDTGKQRNYESDDERDPAPAATARWLWRRWRRIH